jgi:FtsZ-interacting cell division protein ZipA
MTDLQTSLMAIGAAIVVAVITYNKWQEYKTKRSVERAFSSEHDDVLMTPEAANTNVHEESIPSAHALRQEPTFDSTPDAALVQSSVRSLHAFDDDDEISLDLGETVSAPVGEQAAPAYQEPEQPQPQPAIRPRQKDLPLDELVDCLIPLSLETPAWGERILPRLQALRHVGNKPVHFVGQREDGAWEAIGHGSIYHVLEAGVQLANRSTALNEIEYSEFVTSLRQIADEINAEMDVPDMSKVMATARALHQFVSEYDAQLSINVQSNGAPWAIDTLLAALERQGFDLRPDGKLVMPDGDGGVLFSLSTNVTLAAETTSLLTLLLDVPRVAPSRDGFGAMSACARMLAGRLGGVIVDDSGQPLAQPTLDEIAQQVSAFYGQMEQSGIPAGSTRALRLFS